MDALLASQFADRFGAILYEPARMHRWVGGNCLDWTSEESEPPEIHRHHDADGAVDAAASRRLAKQQVDPRSHAMGTHTVGESVT